MRARCRLLHLVAREVDALDVDDLGGRRGRRPLPVHELHAAAGLARGVRARRLRASTHNPRFMRGVDITKREREREG